jgi:hypothetical protein
MTEPRTIRPAGVDACSVVRGTLMSEIVVRSTARSFADYIARKSPIELEDLTPFEVVELTFEYHAEWQSSPERKAEREDAKAAKDAEKAAAKAKRETERESRLVAEKAALEAKLAKLTGSPEK